MYAIFDLTCRLKWWQDIYYKSGYKFQNSKTYCFVVASEKQWTASRAKRLALYVHVFVCTEWTPYTVQTPTHLNII